MNAGFRIASRMERPDPDLIRRAALLPTANIGDAMNRVRCMSSALRPISSPGLRAAGPAFTVKCRVGDNLMLHKALDMAQPGDIIICEAGGDSPHAITGELMVEYAKTRGIAGIIIDGPIRDPEGIAAVGIPVYARGVTPAGPYKDGPGEVGFPVVCGGVSVTPGDLIVLDDSGVVVVPLGEAATVIAGGEEILKKEEEIIAQIRAGKWDRSWVDATLRAKGCEFVD